MASAGSRRLVRTDMHDPTARWFYCSKCAVQWRHVTNDVSSSCWICWRECDVSVSPRTWCAMHVDFSVVPEDVEHLVL